MLVNVRRVCFGSTAQSTPVGSGYSIGCEKPRLNTTIPLPFISARYPIPTISSSLVQPLVTPSTALFTSARQSVNRRLRIVLAQREQVAILLLHLDAGGKRRVQLAFRSLDLYCVAVKTDRHALRDRNRLFPNS